MTRLCCHWPTADELRRNTRRAFLVLFAKPFAGTEGCMNAFDLDSDSEPVQAAYQNRKPRSQSPNILRQITRLFKSVGRVLLFHGLERLYTFHLQYHGDLTR